MSHSGYDTDIGGRPIPRGQQRGYPGTLAVPPIFHAANEQATEVLLSAYANVPANGASAFGFAGGGGLSYTLDQQYVGRIDSVTLFCPDMVTAAAPYLTFHLFVNSLPIEGWSNVYVFPRAGVASVSLDSLIRLPAGGVLQPTINNDDPINAHFVGLYLHGWLWAKDMVQG
jgi:hypothetical protein